MAGLIKVVESPTILCNGVYQVNESTRGEDAKNQNIYDGLFLGPKCTGKGYKAASLFS